MTRRLLAPALAFILAALTASCSGVADPLAGLGLTGDWCTIGALGPDNFPIEEARWVGGTWTQDGSRVSGTGSVKRVDEPDLWPSRFRGDILGDRLVMEVTPLGEALEGAPFLELDLVIAGRNDLVGTVTGDAGIQGDLTLVRLGARCFAS